MGCFWGAERIFWQIDGVYSTAVGYMGGCTKNPTYEETCTARTGHTETVQVVYDPTAGRHRRPAQGVLGEPRPDHAQPTGQRRRHAVPVGDLHHDATRSSPPPRRRATATRRRSTDAGYGQITTEIEPADDAGDGVFYYAEDYHQAYLHKHPGGYCNHGYCQIGYP